MSQARVKHRKIIGVPSLAPYCSLERSFIMVEIIRSGKWTSTNEWVPTLEHPQVEPETVDDAPELDPDIIGERAMELAAFDAESRPILNY
jgi:hypothetical protein